MSTLNWDIFSTLPGAATANFEMLCRALIRRHYESHGAFRAYSNQPGVEFHLKLNSSCSLGDAGRWYGWQCRWYDLSSGQNIGAARRKKILDAIRLTESELPDLTDWVLWTRHTLTRTDQNWFNSLSTHMTLHMWTAAEVEEHLSGPAEILRSTHFGELILRPELLAEKHASSVAPIKIRWQPEVHQTLHAEEVVRRSLAGQGDWQNIADVKTSLKKNVAFVTDIGNVLPDPLKQIASEFVGCSEALAESLEQAHSALKVGDFDVLRQQISSRQSIDYVKWEALIRKLRAGRHRAVLWATNLLADLYLADEVFRKLASALAGRIVAIVAEAGFGKTEMSAQVTAPEEERSAGLLLHGKDLHAGQSLDDLAKRITINGRPIPSFEALVAALDAAGQRQCRRLPIVIDGLNEAEDPRNWRDQLASALVWMQPYANVILVCTLRSAFVAEALPDEVERLQLSGFENKTAEAVRRYFQYYKIDASDADLPWELLRHPLTLRMYCEVTNPERKRPVGVEAMPGSLTGIFQRYIEQASERIAQLAASSCKYYAADVRSALSKIGIELWEKNARSLEQSYLRQCLNDSGRTWDTSIVRALEQEGLLLRTPGEHAGNGHFAVVYDALAGHIVADAIFDKFADSEVEKWLPEVAKACTSTDQLSAAHPLSTDIFKSLVGLSPIRLHRRQLWQFLEEPFRLPALYLAAWLDQHQLDRETVEQLAKLIVHKPVRYEDLFDRCFVTRAANAHPLDADFLDAALRPMTLADRDLRWTEWIRSRNEKVIKDLQRLDVKWQKAEALGRRDQLRARWAMWTLTTTIRALRDHATRALYRFGCREPEYLFELAKDALIINDPYVFERMTAACYGAAMALWGDPEGEKLRTALPAFAKFLSEQIFLPNAPHATTHALVTDYASGIIAIAIKVAPDCIAPENLCYLKAPFSHLASPFSNEVDDETPELAEVHGAIGMDFGNYTIGGIIADRHNYDFQNKDYLAARRKIEYRIAQMGFHVDRFSEIDKRIGRDDWREDRGESRTDRYGKKYSWIAYFEMYGVISGKNLMPESEGARPTDVDIDPSFPEPPKEWIPELPGLFSGDAIESRSWLVNGPSPKYERLQYIEKSKRNFDPWVLLRGKIFQRNKQDHLEVATEIHGLLADQKNAQLLIKRFSELDYPGKADIPDSKQEHYVFAGEMPYSERFESAYLSPKGAGLRDIRTAANYYNGKKWVHEIDAEVPTRGYCWESYHSSLNQSGYVDVLAPAICEGLNLTCRPGQWDLYDSKGSLATLYRRYGKYSEPVQLYLLYLRADLLAEYLRMTNQQFVHLIWGDRRLEAKYENGRSDDFHQIYSTYQHTYRESKIWTP